MMRVIADLQLHSKYSRAVSQQMTIPFIWEWAKRKGIELIATGDWTHPLWMREIKTHCEEIGNGLLRLKTESQTLSGTKDGPYFLLAAEVSCIYTQGGKGRRIHTLVWAPTIQTAEKINEKLTKRGANLMSDGRPIIGLTSIEVADIVYSLDQQCLIIPAHAWTPWFSLYGSQSGFDSIQECFGQFSKYIYAIETGLSSDPSMNWRVGDLDTRQILSFSDAHSGPKLGREATVFEMEELSYQAIRKTIMGNGETKREQRNENHESDGTIPTNHIAYTVEFYPEEGKYHYNGHRNCSIKQTPDETAKKGMVCPVCGRKLTVGVMHRVEDLATRSETSLQLDKKMISDTQVCGIYSKAFPNRPPYIKLVPLQEILSEALSSAPNTQKVQTEYFKLTDALENEFHVLLHTPLDTIASLCGQRVAEGIKKVREEDIYIDPGYDGVFGVVKIWQEEASKRKEEKKDQLSLF